MKKSDRNQQIKEHAEKRFKEIQKYKFLYNDIDRVKQRLIDLNDMMHWAKEFFSYGYENVTVIEGEIWAFRKQLLKLQGKIK